MVLIGFQEVNFAVLQTRCVSCDGDYSNSFSESVGYGTARALFYRYEVAFERMARAALDWPWSHAWSQR
jgi:hypothetical protein